MPMPQTRRAIYGPSDNPSSPWSDGAPNLSSSNPYLWRNQRTIEGAGTVIGNWEGSRIVGRYGTDGTDGLDAIDVSGRHRRRPRRRRPGEGVHLRKDQQCQCPKLAEQFMVLR